MPTFQVGLNPLPWVLTPAGFDLSVPVLRDAFAEIATTPFTGIHADPPADLDAEAYAALLADHGLRPAPGYFSAAYGEEDPTELVERAKRFGGVQAALGNTEAFVAAAMTPARLATPAVGADADPAALQRLIDGLGSVAEAITAEGVQPALHQHVGGAIETEHEVRAVLGGIGADVLGFGPDTGHLRWAGMDPAALVGEFADRVAAVHLKDVRVDQAREARAAGADYFGSTTGPYHVWTEPGRGDVDLAAVVAALPDTFAGWLIVEVDVPAAPTNLESTRISAQWVIDHYGESVF